MWPRHKGSGPAHSSFFSLPLWAEDQWHSWNFLGLQVHIGSAEALGFLQGAASGFSVSPMCRQYRHTYSGPTVYVLQRMWMFCQICSSREPAGSSLVSFLLSLPIFHGEKVLCVIIHVECVIRLQSSLASDWGPKATTLGPNPSTKHWIFSSRVCLTLFHENTT